MEVLTVRRSGMGGLQHVIVREKQGLSGEEVCNFFFLSLIETVSSFRTKSKRECVLGPFP